MSCGCLLAAVENIRRPSNNLRISVRYSIRPSNRTVSSDATLTLKIKKRKTMRLVFLKYKNIIICKLSFILGKGVSIFQIQEINNTRTQKFILKVYMKHDEQVK